MMTYFIFTKESISIYSKIKKKYCKIKSVDLLYTSTKKIKKSTQLILYTILLILEDFFTLFGQMKGVFLYE